MPVTERVATDLPVTIKTATYGLLPNDWGREIQFENDDPLVSITANLLPVADASDGYNVVLRNIGTESLTVSPDGSELIDGLPSISLSQDEWRWVRSDGTEWKSVATSNIALADGSVTSAKLADNAVTESKIATGAVSSSKLAADAVTSDKIAADAVGASEIAADAVGSSEIAAFAVDTAEIANNAVNGAKIAMGGDAQGDILYYDGTDYARLAAGTSGQFLQTQGAAQNPVWASASGGELPRGYLDGLIMTNSSGDLDHDISVSIGVARDDANSEDMSLATAIVKRIDATWVAGTNMGGLDTGVVAASTTYHMFLIKSTGGVVDALFSTSFDNPSMPTDYVKKRRIGSLITDSSSNIVPFFQLGDWFWKKTKVQDYNTAVTTSGATNVALDVPTGQKLGVYCVISVRVTGNAALNLEMRGTDLTISSAPDTLNTDTISIGMTNSGATADNRLGGGAWTMVDDLGRVNLDVEITTTHTSISSVCWIDPRGKDS